eukprot:maker-scaffold137_size321222-snap-gene-2.23 protein:Tk01562 transcript:maker-scaffold137_size321222-snap-gene-2.23-mRNA-1 annotation:"maf1-like protein"
MEKHSVDAVGSSASVIRCHINIIGCVPHFCTFMLGGNSLQPHKSKESMRSQVPEPGNITRFSSWDRLTLVSPLSDQETAVSKFDPI